MTTVVNTPAGDSGGGMGMLAAVLLIVTVIFLFFYFGLPVIRNRSADTQSPEIRVPEKIDINVQNPEK